MDKDKAKSKGQQVKGAAKESWGKMTGQKATEMKGKAEKNYGKGKEQVKNAKEEIHRRTRG